MSPGRSLLTAPAGPQFELLPTRKNFERVLQRLANVDSARWVYSVAIRTSMRHLEVFLVFRGSIISIYGPRSSADSLARAVKFAMRTVKWLEDDHEI